MDRPKPPEAARRPTTITRHGVDDQDAYAWLRAANWQEVMRDPSKLNAEIRAFLESWNAHTDAVMAPTKPLQEKLFAEMKGRIKEDDSSVPEPDGPFDYFIKYRTGGQHPVLMRRPRGQEDASLEQVLLDGDKEAEGKPYFDIGTGAHSHDHKLLAYSIDDKGSEYYTIRIRNIDTGEELVDAVDDSSGAVVWAPSNAGFYYLRVDENHRPKQVFFHALGTAAAEDKLIYEEADDKFFLSIALSENDTYLVISPHDHETSEELILEADAPGAPRLVEQRRPKIEYSIAQFHDTFLIVTNDDAEDFRLMATPTSAPGRANWQELIPHRPGTLLLNIDVTERHLVRLERQDALPRLIVQTISTDTEGRVQLGPETEIAFDEEAYSLSIIPGYEFDTDILRFGYSSPTRPAETIDLNMMTGQRTVRKTQEVPSGHNPADYVVRRIEAPAPDGETIPITVLHRADLAIDGSHPCLLYGYGSYGLSMPAGFSTTRLSLVDRGFVYAIAHIRGGMEKGYGWYTSGKGFQKKNTFTDYFAAGEHLIAKGYAAADKVIGHGGSAGGLLMGVSANERPDLFCGLIAEVPFVDVLNTIWDETLPLTPPEWAEWGNPITDAQACQYIRSYSPYDNVKTQAYPNMLITAGLSDPRVTYWEPAKWAAKLHALKTGDETLLLKTNMDAGHGGASGRFDRLKEDALNYAFALLVSGAAS